VHCIIEIAVANDGVRLVDPSADLKVLRAAAPAVPTTAADSGTPS
jgi:hypothetical protein